MSDPPLWIQDQIEASVKEAGVVFKETAERMQTHVTAVSDIDSMKLRLLDAALERRVMVFCPHTFDSPAIGDITLVQLTNRWCVCRTCFSGGVTELWDAFASATMPSDRECDICGNDAERFVESTIQSGPVIWYFNAGFECCVPKMRKGKRRGSPTEEEEET